MKWKEAITNIIHDIRVRTKEDAICKERRQRTEEVARYMRRFDVDKVELKKSPLGGWMCTFEEDDPTESDHFDELYDLDETEFKDDKIDREQQRSDWHVFLARKQR